MYVFKSDFTHTDTHTYVLDFKIQIFEIFGAFTSSYSIRTEGFQSRKLLPGTTTFWNRFPGVCFPDYYNFNLIKTRVERNISYISS